MVLHMLCYTTFSIIIIIIIKIMMEERFDGRAFICVMMSAGSLAKYLTNYDIPSPLATACTLFICLPNGI